MTQPELLYYDLHDDVVAFSTTRQGGCSVGNYAAFNINHYCGDDEVAIRVNRGLLCQTLGISEEQLIMPHQVHRTEVARIDEAFFHCTATEQAQRLEGIDAVMTDLHDVCIGVSTADCIPILLYDIRNRACAAIHAGWRGTVSRIAEKALAKMSAAYGTRPQDVMAEVGPGISLECFEVGDEVYEAFAAAGFVMQDISERRGKWHIDLPECNRLQLVAAGVPETQIAMSGICTFKEHMRFFSARRLGIQSGRIYTGIMLK